MTTLSALVMLLAFSLYVRTEDKRRNESYEVPEHAKSSPFSEALQELIAHAGGIYLSLVLLISFLHIELADRWNVIGIAMEPLAFLSLLLAAIQPLVMRIYRSVIRS
ncbi:MAG: hypothetical protein NUK65_12220 [Firmicutes bacterium]|nr:hypothetical protein [Bacillota bacterium]